MPDDAQIPSELPSQTPGDAGTGVSSSGMRLRPVAQGEDEAPSEPEPLPEPRKVLEDDLSTAPHIVGKRPLRADDPYLGRRFGGFEVTERIGHGGMGTVYKGRQVSLDRLVAIKILNAQLVDNEEFIRRFEREAKSIARISHPNIVQVHEFGRSEDGVYFMVIEFVQGTNLARLIAERLVLTQEDFLPILIQCLDGLAHVGRTGTVHRDIKPDNILIDESNTAKIADFGLAKNTGQEGDTDLTAHGSAMGTPAYMSPEQCMGRHLDARSDVYALGVTAYLALTGEKPFTGQSSFEIMTKHREHTPPAPIQLNPQLHPDVSALIMKMLAKTPRERCESVEACRDEWVEVAERIGVRASARRSGEWAVPDMPSLPLELMPLGPSPASARLPASAPATLGNFDDVVPDVPHKGPSDVLELPGMPEEAPPLPSANVNGSSFLSSLQNPPPGSGTGSSSAGTPGTGSISRGSEAMRRSTRNIEQAGTETDRPRSVGGEATDSERRSRRGSGAGGAVTCPACGALNRSDDTHCIRCSKELIDPRSISTADRLRRADELFSKSQWREAAQAYARLADDIEDRKQRSVLRSKEREARTLYENDVFEQISKRSSALIEQGDLAGGVRVLERGLDESGASLSLSARIGSELSTLRQRQRRRRRLRLILMVLILGGGIGYLVWSSVRPLPSLAGETAGEVHP